MLGGKEEVPLLKLPVPGLVFGHGTFCRHVAAVTRGVRLAVRNVGRRAAHRNAGTPTELIRVMNPADWGDVGPCAL